MRIFLSSLFGAFRWLRLFLFYSCLANFDCSCRCLGFSFSMRTTASLSDSTTFSAESYPVRKVLTSGSMKMNFSSAFFSGSLFNSYENNKIVPESFIVLYSLESINICSGIISAARSGVTSAALIFEKVNVSP